MKQYCLNDLGLTYTYGQQTFSLNDPFVIKKNSDGETIKEYFCESESFYSIQGDIRKDYVQNNIPQEMRERDDDDIATLACVASINDQIVERYYIVEGFAEMQALAAELNFDISAEISAKAETLTQDNRPLSSHGRGAFIISIEYLDSGNRVSLYYQDN